MFSARWCVLWCVLRASGSVVQNCSAGFSIIDNIGVCKCTGPADCAKHRQQFVSIASETVCCSKCSSNSSCTGWTYHKKAKKCYTTSATTPEQGATGDTVSGLKSPQPPTPPPPPSPPTPIGTTIVVVLADDVDAELTPLMETMPTLQTLVQQAGLTFSNSFVTTPVCCPSRSSILSGLYQHNTKCVRNSIAGGCSSKWWQQHVEANRTLAYHLHQAGWRTGYFGKYLNQYATDKAGVERVPPGWSEWVGLRGNSVYYDYTLSVNGKGEKHGSDYRLDYLVDLLANRSTDFLRSSFERSPGASVLAMIGTPAAHNPYDPAPQYR